MAPLPNPPPARLSAMSPVHTAPLAKGGKPERWAFYVVGLNHASCDLPANQAVTQTFDSHSNGEPYHDGSFVHLLSFQLDRSGLVADH